MGLFNLLFYKLSCLFSVPHAMMHILSCLLTKLLVCLVLLYSADDRGGEIGQPGGVSTLQCSREMEVSPAEV